MHLAGVAALQGGHAARAVLLIQQAVEVQPDHASFHGNLAQAHLALNHLEDAHAAFRHAGLLDPGNPQFAVGAANCLAMQGQLAEAEQQLRAVAQRHPGYALAWFNLGNAVRDQGRTQEAVELYRRALQCDPAFADAWNNLGSVLHGLERFEEAEQTQRRFLALEPNLERGYCNLASVLIDRGRFADAADVCRQGLERLPDSADLQLMLGTTLIHQGNFTAALGTFRIAVDRASDNPRSRWALGTALCETGGSESGLGWLEYVLEQQPESPEFHNAMSAIHLSLGDLQAGWREYEWRPTRRRRLAERPDLPLAIELPAELTGKTICLLGEQGLGDQLFFLRYAPKLKRLGANVICYAHEKITPLLARSPALDRAIPANTPLPAADATMLVGDLPRALGRLEASQRLSPPFPRPRPGAALERKWGTRWLRVFFPELPPPLALTALPSQIQALKQRLSRLGPPPYLGLTWRAGTAPELQHGAHWMLHKKIPLEPLGDALRTIEGTFLALQRRPETGEIERLSSRVGRSIHDFTALNEELEGMLALLALLDDYIAVSNTNVHLRAAAGRTARVLVPRPTEWRWMNAGGESPWFPGLTIYRQKPNGDWTAGLEKLARDMAHAAAARRAET